jgi:TonB family protein
VNRLKAFLLLSLLLHVAFLAIMSRMPLRVPQSAGSEPVRVRLVSRNQVDIGEEVKREKKEQDQPASPVEVKVKDKDEDEDEAEAEADNKREITEEVKHDSGKEVKKTQRETSDRKRVEKTLSEPRVDASEPPVKHEKAREGIAKEEKEETKPSREGIDPVTERADALLSPVPEHVDGSSERKEEPAPPVITEELILEKTLPAYPLVARRRGEEGKVLLRVNLSQSGAVKDVTVQESSGFELLDRAALKAVRRWRFSRKAARTVLVPINFRLK